MAITPIETISMASKSQEASTVKTMHTQREDGAQQQLAAGFMEKTEQMSTRAQSKENVDDTREKFDAKEEGNGTYQSSEERERKKREKEINDEEIRKKVMGSRFNITI